MKNRVIGPSGEVKTKTPDVCTIARSWLGTPYHHMGRVKGAGVDCAMFPLEVYREAGLIGVVAIPFYPPDWNLHREAERYLEGLMSFAREIDGWRLLGGADSKRKRAQHCNPQNKPSSSVHARVLRSCFYIVSRGY